jgi:CopG family nickel-responsive transcriptional regulator
VTLKQEQQMLAVHLNKLLEKRQRQVTLAQPSLLKTYDELIRQKGYQNRSEAVRDMLRTELESARLERHEAPNCVASLSYVYNHHARDLTERLTNLQHEHHHLVLSAMHVHLDHDNCMETVILRGPTGEVSAFANSLIHHVPCG